MNAVAIATPRATRDKTVLTHRGVEALQPEALAYRVPDLRCPGLAVRVGPGGLKTWDVAFRIRGASRVRRLSLGPFPAVGLEAARDRAGALIKAAQAGRDLLAEEKAAKATAAARTTIAQLIEFYLNRKVRERLRTAWEVELRLKRILAPLSDRYADEIARRDLRKILDAAADRGVLREAEKQRELLRAIFGWAQSQDIIETNPTVGISSYGSSPRRDRVLSDDEIRLFWNWLDRCGMPPDYADALKFQLATGCRIGEAAGICRDEIDLNEWIWTLPAGRSKNGRPRATPLVGFAREIVAERVKASKASALFRSEKGDPLTSNCVASLIVRRRKAIPIGHFTSHDLRRTVATGLVDLGVTLDVVAAVLGHEPGSKDVRTLVRHYVRTEMIARKKQALQAWSQKLLGIVGEGRSGAAVVISINGQSVA